MNLFIVEDDSNIIRLLEKIIKDRELGNLVGHASDGITGLEEIQILQPHIVLVDLLMPGKDGISLVREAKSRFPNMQFIMISQVSSKDMIGKSFQSGIEYFISKPVNAIEVESVIQKVQDKLNMSQKLTKIQSLFAQDINNQKGEKTSNRVEEIHKIMQRIGIMGESGSRDIINIIKYLIDTDQPIIDSSVKELCRKFTAQPKTMEQRIRRTAATGMINLANIGIEDYMNDIFTEYSNGLYSFEQMKIEMDHIRGKSAKRGKVNLKKFLEGMVFYSSRIEKRFG